MDKQIAYSVFDVKSIDEEQRVIRGWATTPTPDRVFDVLDPFGAKFAANIPFFKHHDARLVVGRTFLGKPEAGGIPFESRIPKVVEEGTLRQRVEEAWGEIKYRLITGVSVGFLPVREKIEQLKNGGLKFLEYEIVELSMVPVPMQAEAVITQFRSTGGADKARRALVDVIKANDQRQRGASGGPRPVLRLDRGTSSGPRPVVYLDRKAAGSLPVVRLDRASGGGRRAGCVYLDERSTGGAPKRPVIRLDRSGR